jgi:hypothetical protein
MRFSNDAMNAGGERLIGDESAITMTMSYDATGLNDDNRLLHVLFTYIRADIPFIVYYLFIGEPQNNLVLLVFPVTKLIWALFTT